MGTGMPCPLEMKLWVPRCKTVGYFVNVKQIMLRLTSCDSSRQGIFKISDKIFLFKLFIRLQTLSMGGGGPYIVTYVCCGEWPYRLHTLLLVHKSVSDKMQMKSFITRNVEIVSFENNV